MTHKAPHRALVSVPTPEEDRRITAGAKADPDAQPLTAQQLRAMVPLLDLRRSDPPGSAPAGRSGGGRGCAASRTRRGQME